MAYFRRHWYDIGFWVAIVTAIYLVFAWGQLEVLQRLILLNFIGLNLHQVEEYRWPGGGPALLNMIIRPSDAPPDRYPLNQNNAMIANVGICYLFYLLPVFFPNAIWFGLIPVIFGLGQVIGHGIVANIQTRAFYNPGMAAAILFHLPVGIFYLNYIIANDLVTPLDWVLGIVGTIFIAAFLLGKVTYDWLADKNSPFPFAPEEMARFNVPEKAARLKRATY